MIGDELSKQEDRILHRALESVVRTQFPNPRRNHCPGRETLRAIATKRISMRDPAVDHVGHCSPCFAELTDLRRAMHRQSVIWKTATAAAAVLTLALMLSYFGLQKSDPQIGGTTPPRHEIATIDLRNASTARSVQPSRGSPNQHGVEVPRAVLSLTVQLPIGSEAGTYEVQIRQTDGQVRADSRGEAKIDSGISQVILKIDTSTLVVGEYVLAWRMGEFDWRTYPLQVK